MWRKRVVILTTLAVLIGTSTASAQSGGGYDLTWSTLDGGGYTFSVGGGYQLGGTIGQPDAGALSGGGYTLSGGFWGDGTLGGPYRVYLPIVLR